MSKVQHNSGRKICILRSNPVRPDSRVEKEAWSLKKAGYDVHILAWDRDTDEEEANDYIRVAGLEIPITRLGYKATYGEGFKNIKPYLKFQFHMRKWLQKNNFDVVHACDFDTAFFTQGVVRKKKELFVFDIFDFLFGEPSGFMQRCVKKAQFQIINRANATIICTEERKAQIRGSHPRKLAVVHNTPATVQIGKCGKRTEITERVKLVYVGILQDYRLLLEIAQAVSESEVLELHVGGFGKYEDYFTRMAQEYNNIKFYGRLTYEETLSLEEECDIMLAIYDPSIENHRFAAPNKFYESLMIGKPVMMVKNTGMAQIVEDKAIGVVIDYSKESFVNGVNLLVQQRENWSCIGEKMKSIYRDHYCWDEMEKRLLDIYSQILQ